MRSGGEPIGGQRSTRREGADAFEVETGCLVFDQMSSWADVSEGTLGDRSFRNVLAVIDGPRDASHVLAAAVPVVSASHGRLTLLAAVRGIPALGYAGASWIGETGSLTGECERWAADLLAHTARDVPAGMLVQTVLTRDSLRTALPGQIRRDGHDLVIISASAARRCGTAMRVRRARHPALSRCDVPVIVVVNRRRERRARTGARRGRA